MIILKWVGVVTASVIGILGAIALVRFVIRTTVLIVVALGMGVAAFTEIQATKTKELSRAASV